MNRLTAGLFIASLLLAGCVENKLDIFPVDSKGSPEFYASFENNAVSDTKTYVDSGMKLRWTEDDRVSIFVGNTYNQEYKYEGQTGANNGSFSAIGSPEFVSAEPLEANYAVYPYNASNEMDTDGSMSVILPSVQKYAQNSFGLGANTMVAATENKEDNFLQFKNLCGYVVVKLYGEGTVTSIKLEGNDGEKISGKADVQAAYGVLPSVTMSEEATTSITLDCGDGVTLGTTAETATEFWFCVPPVTFSKGFTVTATKADGWQMIKSTSSSKEVVRNTKNALTPIEAVFDQKPDNSAALAQEREALLELYDYGNGNEWSNNDNWCSDAPVNTWTGVETNECGFVTFIRIEGYSGKIPNSVGQFSHLKTLWIEGHLSDVIPEEIGNLHDLETIKLNGDGWYGRFGLTGSIPNSIYHLEKLIVLDLQINALTGSISEDISFLKNLKSLNLKSNNLSGSLPVSLCKCTSLLDVNLKYNHLSGTIPTEIMECPFWKRSWGRIIPKQDASSTALFGDDNNFNIDNLIIPAPEIPSKEFGSFLFTNGEEVNTNAIYPNNKLTIIYDWAENDGFWPEMKRIYNYYHDKGLEIIGIGQYHGEAIDEVIKSCDIHWKNIYGGFAYPDDQLMVVDGLYCMNINVVDNDGFIVFSNYLRTTSELIPFLNAYLGGSLETTEYVSKDYSRDGFVTNIQTATETSGLNVVLMGDAFSDRQINDGTYMNAMKNAIDALFSEVTMNSLKELFNIYTVDVVSIAEGYRSYGGNALGTRIGGDGVFMYGKESKIIEYAQRAISEEMMDNALVIVLLNLDTYAGACNMYYPSDDIIGQGLSIAYSPVNSDFETFRGILLHEAVGHGIGRLADEYAYEENGSAPINYVSEIKSQQSDWGWYKNVDFTSDPTQVKWSKFLSDERYANEGLGCFEGGLTYWSGVWRPTDYSIMRYNTGGFNAPSREAIWYRIHKLAYGEDWQYNYEDFVTYDAINRTPAAQAASRAKVKAAAAARKGEPFQPLHEPVVIKRSWKDAVNNSGKDGR